MRLQFMSEGFGRIAACLAVSVLAGCAGSGNHRSSSSPPFTAPNEPDAHPFQQPFPNLNASRDQDEVSDAFALTSFTGEGEIIDLPVPGETSAASGQEVMPVDPGATTPALTMGESCGPEGCGPDFQAPGGCAPYPPQYVKPGKHAALAHERDTMRAMGIKKPWWKSWGHKPKPDIAINNPRFPRELRMASHPQYLVEPPDVLYIEAPNILPGRGLVGDRLVRQDGTISLGYYGQIHVAGLTLLEVENKIRKHLLRYVEDPQVYVDVASFNSKVYYAVGQVAQQGRLPITGKETALDGILLAGGLTNFAWIDKIHIARPNPGGGCDQVLWVDYRAIAFCGDTRTNYQLMPGDRIVVPATYGFGSTRMLDNYLTPVERVLYPVSLFRFAFGNNNNN